VSISKITIKNFRSIASFADKVNDINIFVGHNDEGKSNILRALDLFFNGSKRHGYELDWSRDYCAFAPERSRKAEEITITLELTSPPNYQNIKPVVWKKIWRKEGLISDVMKHSDKTDIPSKSKLTALFRAMRYDYVPAIKGEEYFQTLMVSLYNMLEATVAGELLTASGDFTKKINDNINPILNDIAKHLELESSIELPSSLRDLFSQLEFRSVSEGKHISLVQRGDGIKVRHIPIILRWLAEQANHLSAPGRPKTMTIWGYEEPENNLELSRCFDLAKEFVKGASTIQTFVTTHSPAFYSVCRDSSPEKVKLFLVKKEGPPPTTVISMLEADGLNSLDSSMGLINLLEPYFTKAREDLERLNSALKELKDLDKPTIFCEGPSDKDLIKEALSLFFADHVDSVMVRCSSANGGGHTWVGDMMIAWSYKRPNANAVGLFDKDSDAQKTKKEALDNLKPSAENKVFGISLTPDNELKECYKKSFSVPFAIEELLPREVWSHAEKLGWLEDRKDPMSLYNFKRTDIAFNEYMKSSLPDAHHTRLALKKIKVDSKKSFCMYVTNLDKEERISALASLKPTLEICLKRLGVID